MFLKNVIKYNPELIESTLKLHRDGKLPPNTFVFDLDMIAQNATFLAEGAKKYKLKTYLMTKQFNRNPFIAKVAIKRGIDSTVAVDFVCARTLNRFGVPVGHIGHLSQIPFHEMANVLSIKPEVITLYSLEAAERLSEVAKSMNVTQDILIKAVDNGNDFYPGQESGIWLEDLLDVAKKIQAFPNIKIVGATAFPCLTYNNYGGDIEPTPNFYTLIDAVNMFRQELGIEIKQVNAPGNTSCAAYPILYKIGATHVEPGHGLTATTPEHIFNESAVEKPACVYLTEISHKFGGKAYAYGGGLYVCLGGGPAGYPVKALVGNSYPECIANKMSWEQLGRENVDYYAMLTPGEKCDVGDTVIFGFRSQIFYTRAYVAAVSGISDGKPVVQGLFDAACNMLDSNYNVIPVNEVSKKIEAVLEIY